MLWVLKRTVSMRRFFWAPKTYAKSYWEENIYNFTLKILLTYPVYIIFLYSQCVNVKKKVLWVISVMTGPDSVDVNQTTWDRTVRDVPPASTDTQNALVSISTLVRSCSTYNKKKVYELHIFEN